MALVRNKNANDASSSPDMRGFTLVETLVAITLLMLVMVAFMALARIGLSVGIFSRERVTAFFLAQDAMQYIVNMHYNDIREQSSNLFQTHIIGNCAVNGCIIDTLASTPSVQPCTGTCTGRLYLDGASRFTIVGVTASPFSRIVTVQTPSTYETIVTVTVSWLAENGTTGTVSLERHFFDIADAIYN